MQQEQQQQHDQNAAAAAATHGRALCGGHTGARCHDMVRAGPCPSLWSAAAVLLAIWLLQLAELRSGLTVRAETERRQSAVDYLSVGRRAPEAVVGERLSASGRTILL